MGILSTLYTVLGGIEAVVWTDVVQTLVLLGGAVAALVVMAGGVDGGIPAIYSAALEQGKFRMINPTWDWIGDGLPVILLAAVFNNLVSYSTDQAVIQRYLTTADQKQAGRAIWTNAWLAIPASLLFFFVGTALFIFYQTTPTKLPPLEQTDQLFAWFIAREMPAGLAGLVIAGVFAAAMSSLDSSIHSVATAITTDFVRRFSESDDESRLLIIARVLTVILGVAGTVSAALMAGRDIQYLFTVLPGTCWAVRRHALRTVHARHLHAADDQPTCLDRNGLQRGRFDHRAIPVRRERSALQRHRCHGMLRDRVPSRASSRQDSRRTSRG